MFGLFLTGLVLDFVVLFLLPLSVFTRWLSLPLALLTLVAALTTTVATAIATAMFLIMRMVITGGATQLNIRAEIGIPMFVFMWIAAGCSIVAFAVQAGMCCCCASRRDVRKGRKRGSEKAWTMMGAGKREA
jgi:hypothetical protein